ncbi:hypothetical protein [Halomontanus rarus]|uniref:hypothetical protein n=1 Tax=Halomontanus rarus TaxID=3034020 RepID=UPI00307BAA7F
MTPDTQTDDPLVEEWQAVPTRSHPEAGIDDRYPCAPGPADGLTEAKARELARGRNRAGEPSPTVTWHAEPTGREQPRPDLFDVDRSDA